MFIAIVPAYNEEKRIGSVIRSLFDHVDEVIVVNDGSSDRTAQIALETGATVISHRINRGQGAALETGHEYARRRGADYVIHFDADGQFHVEDIAPALQKLQESQVDVLLGSRFLQKNTKIPWQKKYILLPLARFFHKKYLRLHLSDVHNGFRIFNQKALHHIRIKQDRMAHATEILQHIQRNNLTFVEHPVKVTYHEYGQRSMQGVDIIKDLFTGNFLR